MFGIVLLVVGSMRVDTMIADSFDALFGALSGLEASVTPFPWQRTLLAVFAAVAAVRGRAGPPCDTQGAT